jgi:hypothetical protein
METLAEESISGVAIIQRHRNHNSNQKSRFNYTEIMYTIIHSCPFSHSSTNYDLKASPLIYTLDQVTQKVISAYTNHSSTVLVTDDSAHNSTAAEPF